MTSLSLSRIWGIVLRHLAVYRFNLARLQDFLMWPLFELLLWGFLALYVQRLSQWNIIVALLVSTLILWNVFARISQGLGVNLLMELWSRNIMNVFVSPISTLEYVIALVLFGLIRIVALTGMLALLASVLYHVNVFAVGFSLIPLAIGLVTFGWAVGILIMALILRYGQSVESLAFGFAFFLQPFGAVFFPLSIYPHWLQLLTWWVPLSHIFENLRRVFTGQPLDPTHLLWMFGLSVLYLIAAFAFFGVMFEHARKRGLLLKLLD